MELLIFLATFVFGLWLLAKAAKLVCVRATELGEGIRAGALDARERRASRERS